jgi:hypothetical protein
MPPARTWLSSTPDSPLAGGSHGDFPSDSTDGVIYSRRRDPALGERG